MKRQSIPLLLRVLSDRRCMDILNIISVEPSYTGELASQLRTTESRISEKIRMMKSAGMIAEEWKREGNKLVKYLKPSMRKINISLNGGLRIETISEKLKEITDYEHMESSPPSVKNFVGRKDEYGFLKDNSHVLITGIPGIGKSSLAAHFVNTQGGSTFWHEIRETDNIKHILIKMAIFLQRLGEDALINSLQTNRDRRVHVNLAIAGMRKTNSILVLDDAHRCKDAEIIELIRDFLQSVPEVKVILVARSKIPLLSSSLRTLVLGELSLADATKLAGEESKSLVRRVGGHPLLLKIMSSLPAGFGERPVQIAPDEYVRDVILPSLPKGIVTIIQKLSFFRGGVNRKDAEFILGKFNDDDFRNAEDIDLLRSRNGIVSVNDLIKEAAYRSANNREDAHFKLSQFYVSKNSPEGLIEGFHHLWKSGRNEEILKFLDRFGMQLVDSGHMNNFQKELKEASDSLELCEAKTSAMFWVGRTYRNSRNYGKALEYFSNSRQYPHTPDLEMRIVQNEAVVRQYMGDIEGVRKVLENGLKDFREKGETAEGDILNALARALTYLGEMKRAGSVLKRSMEIFSKAKGSRGYCVCLFDMAFLEYVRGNSGKAWEINEKAASCFLNLNSTYGYAATLQARGFILESMGKLERAVEKYDEVIDILESLGFSPPDRAFILMKRSIAKIRLGRLDEASKDIASAKKIISPTGDELLKGMLDYVEGKLLLHNGRINRAEVKLTRGMKYESGDPIFLWGVRMEMARLLASKGKRREARELILQLIGDLKRRSFLSFLPEATEAYNEIVEKGLEEQIA